MIKCLICKERFLFIHHTHLAKHGITTGQYKKKFPGCKISSNKRNKNISNSGLGREFSQESRKKIGKGVSNFIKENGSPHTGRKRTKQTCENISNGLINSEIHQTRMKDPKRIEEHSQRVKQSYANGKVSQPIIKNSWSGGGFKSDLGIAVRSDAEADYLRYLKMKGIKFVYEPRRFVSKSDNGKITSTYCPDIYRKDTGEYLEVGQPLQTKSGKKKQRRIDLFKESYPNIKFRIITYKRISKIRSILNDYTPNISK